MKKGTSNRKSLKLPPGTREIAVFEAAATPVLPPLEESVAEMIRDEVAAGYLGDRDLLTRVVLSPRDQATAAAIRKLARPLLAAVRRSHAGMQRTWQELTDCERLDAAFKALWKSGVLARQNYWCCGSCAALAMADELRKAKNRHRFLGGVYFDDQHTQRAVHDGKLVLSIAVSDNSRAAALDVSDRVVRALRAAGLKATRGKRPFSPVTVAMKWRRRTSRPLPDRPCQGARSCPRSP